MILYLTRDDLIERFKDKDIEEIGYIDFIRSYETFRRSSFVVFKDGEWVKILKSRMPYVPKNTICKMEVWVRDIEPYFKDYRLPPYFQTTFEAK